jgi:hypothetical protein
MATKKDDKPADPYADWSPEEKEEWERGAKFRARATEEMSGGITESIKGLLFNDKDGGGVDDPDGDDTDAGDKPADEPGPWVPWWERKIGGKKP